LPVLAGVFRRRKRPVGRSWRMDETYIKVSGQWKYLYRAVDRDGNTVDFLLTAKRDLAAARRFLERAINLHDVPERITIDRSGAETAAIESVKADACVDILMRQNKYLNNIVEQDHRAIKRVTRPMLGFSHSGAPGPSSPDRDHVHDSQGADGRPRRPHYVRGQPVLQSCSLINRPPAQPSSTRFHYRKTTVNYFSDLRMTLAHCSQANTCDSNLFGQRRSFFPKEGVRQIPARQGAHTPMAVPRNIICTTTDSRDHQILYFMVDFSKYGRLGCLYAAGYG